VTTAKLVPIVVFIIVCVFALKAGVFAHNFWGRRGQVGQRAVRSGEGHDAAGAIIGITGPATGRITI
jgi:amino acid transporter